MRALRAHTTHAESDVHLMKYYSFPYVCVRVPAVPNQWLRVHMQETYAYTVLLHGDGDLIVMVNMIVTSKDDEKDNR